MRQLAPKNVVFWSGAGISHDPPANCPLGRVLTDRALTGFFDPTVVATLRDLYEALDVSSSAVRPRLETVLDALFNVYGTAGLAMLLGDLAGATPNQNHRFFAEHVSAGGSHVTANFDTCIERAGSGLPADLAGRVVHFHGSLGPDRDAAGLGARLAVIQHGLSDEMTARLDRLVLGPHLEQLVFVGYSGSDFFDATPYLIDRLVRPGAAQVIWFEYAPGSDLELGPDPSELQSDLARRLVAAGVPIQTFTGQLSFFLNQMAERMGLPPVQVIGDRPYPSSRNRPNPSPQQRITATFYLFSALGYAKGIVELWGTSEFRDQGLVTTWDSGVLAQALWSGGRYREALRFWRKAYRGNDPRDRARLAEREAAVAWVRGSLLRAERQCWAAVQRWCGAESGADLATRAALLELYGRIAVHMRRLPETRPLVRQDRAREALLRLKDISDEISRNVPFDQQIRVEDVQAVLRERRGSSSLAGHIDTLQEAESLNAWLNYEHARLRDRAGSSTPPSAAEYRKHQDRFRQIGAYGDAARVPLLPGGAAVFTIPETVGALLSVDLTGWHKIRLIGSFCARRAAYRARARTRLWSRSQPTEST